MTLAPTIAGVRWGRIDPHVDDRGWFRELGRASATESAMCFVQANLSSSSAGVLRGLHYHEHQLDHWVVLEGEVFVALADLRERDVKIVTRVLIPDDVVTIPAMVAHGFLALQPTKLLYLVTKEYDGTDEHGLAWNDPHLDIPWPRVPTALGTPIVSQRDANNPSLTVLRSLTSRE